MISAKYTRFSVCALNLTFLLSFGLLGVSAQTSQSTIKPFFIFKCNPSRNVCPNGQQPTSVIQSADGNVYGTTEFGGNSSQAAGTVFKLSARRRLTTIFTFVGDQNGGNPTSLLEGNDGNVYGTTNFGGANNGGVVFKLSKSGTIQVLHNFCSLAACADGNGPFNLVLGSDGNLYGATSINFSQSGTLFRVTRKGSYTLLHTFNAELDGPQAIGMMLGSDGNIYGTTQGASNFPTVLFQLTPAGQVNVVHSWRYPQFPVSPPTQVSDGTLWGALSQNKVGDANAIFSIQLSGSGYEEIPLLTTPRNSEVGFMTEASDGNFWGTHGPIASFTFAGAVLQELPFNGNNTTFPVRLLQASSGRLVGFAHAVSRDEQNPGEIFVIQPSLPAPKPLFVSFYPARGKIGAKVVIQGVHFVGATAVAFNGVKANFRVLNTGNVIATVPGGATTGAISVTNAGGMTASTNIFVVE